MLSVYEEDVTEGQKAVAKAINFGVVFGMGAKSLARHAAMLGAHAEVAEAQRWLNSYNDRHPGVAAWRSRVGASAPMPTRCSSPA